MITSTGLFKQLLAQVAMFKNEANEAKSLFEKLTVEADALRDGRKVFEDTTLVRLSPLKKILTGN